MPWQFAVFDWLARAALDSLPLLAACGLALAFCRQPARRARLITWTLGGCLVVPWLGLLPGWPRWAMEVTGDRLRVTAGERGGVSPPVVQKAGSGQDVSAERGLRSAELVGEEEVEKSRKGEPEGKAERSNHPAMLVASSAIASNPQSAIRNPQLPAWLTTAYLAGVAAMTAWWLAGVAGLVRLLRRAHPAEESCRRVWKHLAGDAGRRTRLLVSPRVAQPFTFTCWRPVVVLPPGLCQPGHQQALLWSLAHEWSHVARRDAWSWTLAGVARVVFFYQPLVWWLRSRLRLEQDYLADSTAAGHAPAFEDYAEFLTSLVTGRLPRPVVGLGIGGRQSELYRRVVMLIARRKPLESRCPRVWSFATAFAAVMLVLGASTYGDPPAGPPSHKVVADDDATGVTPESDAIEAADRQRADEQTTDKGQESEVRRLVDLALKRSKAITGGEFLFQFMVFGNPNSPQATTLRFRQSGPSWSLEVIDRNLSTISHAGRTVHLGNPRNVIPTGTPSMTISHAKPWWSEAQPLPPVQAGTIWYAGTRQFIDEHRRDARLGDSEEINGVAVRRLEWNVSADELSAFHLCNQMLEQGGLLRLYVAEELAGALPRMEYVDRFGTVQATFEAAEFKKQKHLPDIYLPKEFSIHFGGETNYLMLEVKRLNEPIPAEEFSDFEVPAGTKVSDTRPKRTDTMSPDGRGPFTTQNYPFRQFTTGAAYPHGLPAELLKEMDRDVVSPEDAKAAEATRPTQDTELAQRDEKPRPSKPKKRGLGNQPKLRYGGKTFAEWEEQLLTDLEPESRIKAIEAIGVLGANGFAEEAVQAISQTFAAGNAAVNSTACRALAKIGAPAVEILVAALDSNTQELPKNALWAIAEIGPPSEAALPALLTICADRKSELRPLAAFALAKVGAADGELTSTFRQLIRDNDSEVRCHLVGGLAERFRENPRVLPLLLIASEDLEPQVRTSAGQALVAHAYKTETVIAALKRLARDEEASVWTHVLSALSNERENVETTTPVLVDAIAAPDFEVGGSYLSNAVQALGRTGPKAAAAVPALIEMVKGQGRFGDSNIIQDAIDALGRIGPGAKEAVPVLELWVDGNAVIFPQNPELRRHAARALERIRQLPPEDD